MKPSPESLFRALADPTRLRILALLQGGEVCVCDLTGTLRLGQSRISRHLSYLKRSGLVRDRKQGRWRHYALAKAAGPLHGRLLQCLRDCLPAIEVRRRSC